MRANQSDTFSNVLCTSIPTGAGDKDGKPAPHSYDSHDKHSISVFCKHPHLSLCFFRLGISLNMDLALS